jgi:DNA-binding MarR family transcriptional regulator
MRVRSLGRSGHVHLLEIIRQHDIPGFVEESERAASIDLIGEALDQAADLTLRHLADRVDLSTTTASLLNRLDRNGPARLTMLAAAEGVSQPSMTQVIQRLERQHLVARLSDPDDGRAALVIITEGGRALLAQRTRARRHRLAQLSATLSADDQFALWLSTQVALPILRRLSTNANTPAKHDGNRGGGSAKSGRAAQPVAAKSDLGA